MVAEARGQANRFNALLTQYQDAPAIMRERLYLDTLSEVYSGTPKVMVDVTEQSPLMVLPMDRLKRSDSGSKSSDGETQLDPQLLERLQSIQSSSSPSSSNSSSNGIRREGR